MQTKETIRFAMKVSQDAVLSVIEEMSDAPTTFPTSNGGCHPPQSPHRCPPHGRTYRTGHIGCQLATVRSRLKGDET